MASQSQASRILLTRPADQGARFEAELRACLGAGVEVLSSPLLAPAFVVPVLPDGPFDAVIFTSETAVEAASALAGLPARAFAVGDRTAAVARAAGYATRSAGGDAEALVGLVIRDRPGRVLHLRGQETRGDVVARLRQAGVPAAEAVVYDQRPQPLSPAARAWLEGEAPVIAPLFSPRTAALLSQAAIRAPLWIVALSPAVQDAAVMPATRRMTASRPDSGAMVQAVAALIAEPLDP
jgi:uroporphyrinogen-III synthase